MTTTNWTRVTYPNRNNTFAALTSAQGELAYVSSTPMTTSDQIGASATDTSASPAVFALTIPAYSTLVDAFLDANQVDTSGAGAFNVGTVADPDAIMAAVSVASATTNNRIINRAPTNGADGYRVTSRGIYFPVDTAIIITPSTNVGTVNVAGGIISLTLVYFGAAPYGI